MHKRRSQDIGYIG